MKIAFSTLGCPGWSFADMLVTAKDLGFDGIEVRGIENEMYVPGALPFSEANIQATKGLLAKMNLTIPSLTSSCCLNDKEKNQHYMNEGREYVNTAAKLGVPYVRVLGDYGIIPDTSTDFDYVASNLKTLADYAEDKKVMILIETNGVLANSDNITYVLNKASSSNVGVLWDVHHPYRFYKEPVEKTFNALKDKIRFVHIKDSVEEYGNIKYKMTGYGNVPVEEALRLLLKNDYEGFVSLEWVKRWCMDLEEPGVVFSHFIYYVKGIIG